MRNIASLRILILKIIIYIGLETIREKKKIMFLTKNIIILENITINLI